VELRKSSRIRRPAISTDYVVYLQEYDAMKEEMESMAKNQVWDLVDLPK